MSQCVLWEKSSVYFVQKSLNVIFCFTLLFCHLYDKESLLKKYHSRPQKVVSITKIWPCWCSVFFSRIPPWSQSRSTISSENKLTLMTLIDISNPRGDRTKSKLEFLPDDWFSYYFQATIFVGISLLISNVITLIVANKMPRRLMLILSSFGISGALIGMGVYFHFKSLELEACGTGISAENCEDIYTHSIRYIHSLYIHAIPKA